MRFLRNNGLTIALILAFLGSMIGMTFFGWRHENLELARHGLHLLSFNAYLKNENFLSALFENWESEWLQMATYVILTAYLFQKGSAESRDPDRETSDNNPAMTVRRSNWFYEHSLGLVLAVLFLLSFAGHFLASRVAYNSDAVKHGEPVQSVWTYLSNAQFWFESFQNWQSEFFSTAALVVLSIFLRYKGSPESKPVHAANDQTGD